MPKVEKPMTLSGSWVDAEMWWADVGCTVEEHGDIVLGLFVGLEGMVSVGPASREVRHGGWAMG